MAQYIQKEVVQNPVGAFVRRNVVIDTRAKPRPVGICSHAKPAPSWLTLRNDPTTPDWLKILLKERANKKQPRND